MDASEIIIPDIDDSVFSADRAPYVEPDGDGAAVDSFEGLLARCHRLFHRLRFNDFDDAPSNCVLVYNVDANLSTARWEWIGIDTASGEDEQNQETLYVKSRK